MILKFEEYCKINEGVESVVSLSDAKKILEPNGWIFTRGKADSCKFSKGKYVVYFHLKHGNSIDDNRRLDVGSLDKIREYLIDEFMETGDMTLLKEIPWNKWRLPNPFDRELKEYDQNTGKKKEKEVKLNIGQQLNMAKNEKSIRLANDKYKDASLWKIDYEDENSAYIICFNGMYNTCKSPDDRRPLLKSWNPTDDQKDWTPYYKDVDGKILFGKENWKKGNINYYEILSDGSLRKVIILSESKEY